MAATESRLTALDGDWIDISRPIAAGIPVWPGDRVFEVEQRWDGHSYVSAISATCHLGTHIDAPLHLDRGAPGVECVPLTRCVGLAEVVRVESTAGVFRHSDLDPKWEPAATRILIRTDSHLLGSEIDHRYVAVAPRTVEWLADRGMVLLGIDTPSVDLFSSRDLPAHHALMRRGVTWIEGLNLVDVKPGLYEMVALPMPLQGVEAAPVRAIIRRFRG